MKNDIPDLNKAGLRRFALTTAGLMAVVFGVIMPVLRQKNWHLWPWVVALVLILWGLVLPESMRLLYRWWMVLALFLGKINCTLLLTLLYLFIISPLGIVLRLCGYDPLHKKKTGQPSYRKQSVIPQRNHMEKPY